MKTQLSVKKIWRAAPCALALFWAQASPAEVAFTQVTEGELVNDTGHYYGLAWGDYDGDGWVDLFMGNIGNYNRLYHNEGDGTFSRVLTGAIAEDTPAIAAGSSWADYDNDGDLDLFVPSIWISNFIEVSDRFFRNEGGGDFTRISDGDWLPTEQYFAQMSCWGDLDKDGFVDLYVANSDFHPDFLYMNNGDGTMSGAVFSIAGDRVTHSSAMSDIDMDGDADLLIAHQTPSMIYLNDGTGNLSSASGPPFARHAYLDGDISPADYDNDGDLDLVVVGYLGNRLYENDGSGGFTEITDGAIYSVFSNSNYKPAACAAWGDYDNDGRLDLFIGRSEVAQVPFTDLLYHNEGNGAFSQVVEVPLVSREGYSLSAAWADYDNDGDLDLVVCDGNNNSINLGSPVPVVLYRNDGGNQNNWCIVSLQGVVSNRSAFGAKVRATATINGELVTQLREINGHNSELRAHFGLGNATVIDTLEIEWPSGEVDLLSGLATNQILEVVEGQTWMGYLVPENNWIDTGSFLGWIYVGFSPHVYVLNLNKYIYLPEEYIGPNGAWAFVGK